MRLDLRFGHAHLHLGQRRFERGLRYPDGLALQIDFLGRLVQAHRGDFTVNVDEFGTGQRLLQGEEIEHPHALALDADSRALAQLRQGLARRHEGAHVAGLVTPGKHLARETDGREGTHFEMRHNGDGLTRTWHDDRERPFHLVEVLAEDAAEVGAGHQHHGVKASVHEHL